MKVNQERNGTEAPRDVALFSVSVFFCILLLSGCSSQRERDLFRDYRDVERSTYSPRAKLPNIDKDSSLDKLMLFALLNNPGIEAAFNRWKAAVVRMPQERTLPNPRLKYMYFFDPFITEGGEMTSDLGIMMEFPWPSKLWLQRDVALDEARAEGRLFEAEQLKVVLEVADAYYEYYYWNESVRIVRENLVLVRQLEQVARAAYEAGTASNADVIRAQVELGRLENELRTTMLLRKPVVARLNAVLNRTPDATLPEPQQPEIGQLDADEDTLLLQMFESNPELLAMVAETESRRNATELARTRYLPDFAVETSFMGMDSAVPSRIFSAGISISLPIWFSSYDAGVREAEARRTDSLKRFENRRNELSWQLSQAVYYFHDAERRIDLYGNALIPKAVQSLNVSRQAFEAGDVSFLELLDSERTLLSFQLAHKRAVADRAQRLAEIHFIIGRPVRRTDTTD